MGTAAHFSKPGRCQTIFTITSIIVVNIFTFTASSALCPRCAADIPELRRLFAEMLFIWTDESSYGKDR